MIVALLLILCLLGVSSYGARIFLRGSYCIGGAVMVLAIIGGLFVARPEYSTAIANVLGVGRGADLLLYLFFMLAMVLILLVHSKFEQQNILITSLARSIALNSVVQPKKLDESLNAN